jgi:FKBP-type peptidyl-prolyl cis-trans isomerase FklB
MKKNVLLVLLVCGVLAVASCQTGGGKSAKLQNDLDSVSYSLGVSIGQNLKMNGLADVNSAAFARGIEDFLKDEKTLIEPFMADQIINNYIMGMRTKESEKNIKESEDFLAQNSKKAGVQTTPSGLQYEMIEKGTGASPDENDMVTVHYTGKTINGNVFDSSVERGEPVTFGVNQVIPGWTEGLQMMQEGGKARFYIPSELGYGERGAGPDIPPHSALIFDVELISVERVN